jgi:hypothetical protein
MNTGLLNSFASMVKGSILVTDAIKAAFSKFEGGIPSDDQVLVAISEVAFTVTLNKDARQVLSFYLIQLYANQLFISDPSSEFGVCMRIARREIDTLLSFSVLDRIAKYVWEHREQFLMLWTVFAENSAAHPESTSDILGATLTESIQLLEAA